VQAPASDPVSSQVRGTPLLICSRVARQFGRRRVLRDVSFEGYSGEVLGILGPNGSGKTTLLGVLSTLAEPSRGRVSYPAAAALDSPRRMIGVLGHEPQLYGELTARENLELFARLSGITDVAGTVARALEQARLADRADDFVERFSRGMRQRLAFERVLLPSPQVLLLDEPFTGLDDESAQRMVDRLAMLRDAGTLVVLATHDLLLVESLVDRACIVKGGVLVPLDRTLPLAEAYRAAVGVSDGVGRARSPLGAPKPAGEGGSGAPQGVSDQDRPRSENGPYHDGRAGSPSPVHRQAAFGERALPTVNEASMADIARAAGVLLAKDLRIEWRSREGLLTTACFALSCVLVFSFGLVRNGTPMPDAGPAVLWVTIALAGTLAMARTFERERAAGTLMAVLTSSTPRPAIYLGKWGALMALMFAVEIVLLPLVALFFQMPLDRRPLLVVGLLAAGTTGYAAIGTLFAAMLARTRTRDVLLPLLLYPMSVPVIIGGVRGTTAALADPYVPGVVSLWLPLLICFDAVFAILALWTFGTLMTEAAPRVAKEA
jgi:heme exporter protein CcmB